MRGEKVLKRLLPEAQCNAARGITVGYKPNQIIVLPHVRRYEGRLTRTSWSAI